MFSHPHLQNGLQQLQLNLSESAQDRLIHYLHLLQKWNKAYNLTAITDFDKMITYHLLDSLSIVPYIFGDNIVDVGSGAGLPGIPLAIYFPNKQFTLIDSVGKKTRFMTHAVRELQLANVEVVNMRAEQYLKTDFDTMIARAVASVEELIHISKHLLKPSGQLLMMKSELSSKEALPENATVVTLQVPGINTPRTLVIM